MVYKIDRLTRSLADFAKMVEVFDARSVSFVSVDRLRRSLQDLVGFLSELHAAGIDLFLLQQGIDTTTRRARRCSR